MIALSVHNCKQNAIGLLTCIILYLFSICMGILTKIPFVMIIKFLVVYIFVIFLSHFREYLLKYLGVNLSLSRTRKEASVSTITKYIFG